MQWFDLYTQDVVFISYFNVCRVYNKKGNKSLIYPLFAANLII